ncbi:unnamed protein product [Durusdinium trenchii]|uniref:Uncharacterized protein n=2 Tax=Durusdinium trenchii TaxID=1381693 RepID=A0ABP0JKG5_9DINO
MSQGAKDADGGPSSSTYTGGKSTDSSATYKGSTGYPNPPGSAASKPVTLRAAVKACEVDAVTRALQKLENVDSCQSVEAALDATDGMGRTLLHLCATNSLRLGTDGVVNVLLARRARPDVRDCNDQTPLAISLAVVASADQRADTADSVAGFHVAHGVVSSLLRARATVVGQDVLEKRLACGVPEVPEVEDAMHNILSLMKEAGDGLEDTETIAQKLMLAVDGHDATGVECLLSKVHARSNGGSATSDLTRAFDVDGNTLLHRCAAGPSSVSEEGKDGEKVVEFLVAARADVNNSNLLGETPLLAAARGRPSVGVVSALLRARADPNHPDTIASETALMELACQGETNLCRLLLESHADGLLRNRHGRNARDLAIENRHSEVVLLFGEFGITADAAGAPAVDLDALQAVQRCDLERMQGLLSDLTDHECQKLLTRGVDDSGRQLLHIAASKGSEEDAADMARLLLDYGAPMGGADFAGETPLSLAVAASLDAVLRGTVEGEKGASKDGSAWAALDTIRVLLVAGASPSDAIGLSSSTSKLREALQEHPEDVADLCRLLQAFGAEFQTDAEDPDADASEDRDFTEDRESVPPDLEKRLGSLGAKVVMASCSKWRQMNAKQLRAECAEVGIPTDGCVEKGELIERLRQLRIWQAMPLSVLQEEIGQRGLSRAEMSRAEMEDLLLVSMYNGRSRRDRILESCLSVVPSCRANEMRPDDIQEMCKSKNIPIDKLSDLNKAEVVLKQVKRFEEGSVSDLKREFERRGLVVEAGTEKQDMLAKLSNVLVWDELSLSVLQKVCSERSLGSPFGATREELIQRLHGSLGQVKMAESRFKNFFNYGNPSRPQSQANNQQGSSQSKTETKSGFGDYDHVWEAKAEENRRAFAAGNRNHAGMPTGQRRHAGPGPPPGNQGVGGAKRPSAAPQSSPIERYFRSLGLPKTATHDEVRKAYRKLALQHHPDKNPGQKKAAAEIKFREVAEAYDKVCEYLRQKS